MRYKIYIDYDGSGYVEFEPLSVDSFSIKRNFSSSDGSMEEYFSRLSWGKVRFANKPLKYKDSHVGTNKLFDVINEIDYNVKILVKHVTDLRTIYGYFGKNDCNFDYDNKVITVSPTIIDKYTNFLENYDTEVDMSKYDFGNTTINIPVQDFHLVTVQDWPTKANAKGWFIPDIPPRNRVKESDYNDNGLLTYFENDGAPKQTLFADTYWGFWGQSYIWSNLLDPPGTFSLADRVQIMEQSCSNDIDSDTYGPSLDIHYGDYELSRLRIYEGTRTGGLSGNRWRNLYCETSFSRDEIVLVDQPDDNEDFGFTPPVGAGWHMRQATTSNGKAAHMWTRKPFDGAYSGNWTLAAEVVNDSSTQYSFSWYKYLESKIDYTTENNFVKIQTSIKLNTFVDQLLIKSSTDMDVTTLKSTFFYNDFQNTLQFMQNILGSNYVTGTTNLLSNIRLIYTYDLLNSGGIRKTPKVSLKKFMQELNKVFGCSLCYFIDDDGYLRFEHKKYIDLTKVVLDISESDLIDQTMKWDFDKSAMFQKIEYKQNNSGFPDFTDNVEVFDRLVSNNRSSQLKLTNENDFLSTDIEFATLNPQSLNDGMIIAVFDSNNKMIETQCPISNTMKVNGYLALSNVLNNFGRYEGVWNSGFINDIPTVFENTIRAKIGIDILLKGTVESLFYKTLIGEGIIDAGTIDFEKEFTKVKIRYRYNSNVYLDQDNVLKSATIDDGRTILVFQKAADFDGAEDIIANIGNY